MELSELIIGGITYTIISSLIFWAGYYVGRGGGNYSVISKFELENMLRRERERPRITKIIKPTPPKNQEGV